MSEEKDLIKRRASYKGRLTVFTNYLNKLEEPLVDNNVRELQIRMGKIESMYEQYDEVQLQLECFEDKLESQLVERANFESLYYQALSTAQGLIDTHNKTLNKLQNSSQSSHNSNHRLVKLPTIHLPKFSGSYDNWLEFHDTFSSLIHCNDEIDDANKFHYLRASLEGSAAVIIQSIDLSANNYAVAWKLLCDRYDNKRLLIQNHVSALFHIDAITKESSSVLKRFIDQINKNLRALESLGEPVGQWDTLLIYIVTQKLDSKTYREWEEFKGQLDQAESCITFGNCLQFLRKRADLIETLELSRSQFSNHSGSHHKSSPKMKSMVTQSSPKPNVSQTKNETPLCSKCKGDHTLNNCPQFLALNNEARFKALPGFRVCFNCFKSGHYANTCKRPGCKICKRRHNTLVHVDQPKFVTSNRNNTPDTAVDPESRPQASNVPDPASSSNSCVALSSNIASSSAELQSREVLLSTALVKLYDNDNREHVVRAVLDSGSTSCLLTTKMCHKLNLPTDEIDRSILGVNNVTSHVGETCSITMKSLDDTFVSNIQCYVLPSITSTVPSHEINISELNIPSHLCLADPMFYKPSEVDLLIGADLFWDLLGSQQIRLGNKKPVLCDTKLGWIVSGPLPINHGTQLSNDVRCHFSKIGMNSSNTENDIQTDLTRFWQLEEVDLKSPCYSPDEQACEINFTKNTTRLDDGRFCVRIPLKSSPTVLGDSFQKAKQCLFSIERRLLHKPDIRKMYHDFMTEYQSLDHMTVSHTPILESPAYFMPHHGVLRENSTTTKLGVLYNASSPTTSGMSLNDIQMDGPTVQNDLLSILLRFRQHKYILSADVEKMYRQIVVHPSDRHLQQILWRDDPCETVKVFQLNTVTYGTASAPFLATRCLRQIGLDCTDPKVAEVIKHDFYVDDLLSGSDDLTEVKALRKNVTNALASAGMTLRKFVSNEPQVVNDCVEPPIKLNIGSNEPNKLLGLGWHSHTDMLCFPIGSQLPNSNTKRDILSAIARIFDPLGLLSPCVIVMKMLLQKLWLHKLSWDESLTPDIYKCWSNIVKFLPLLDNLYIPRHVICDSYKTLELHAFMDASESAYGACVYIRSINDTGEVMVRLLMAKSRVAPIKPTTIPRLELCGALIGARLYEKVSNSLRVKLDRVYFWTDSTIVLGWLRMLPSRLQPFVRNRVAEILEKTVECTWKHVPTNQNPADLISRGVDISALQTLDMWWSGPEYLSLDQSCWPSQPKHIETTLPETRPHLTLNAIVNETVHKDNLVDFNRFSKYLRLVRTIAYVLRFVRLCRTRTVSTAYLEEHELRSALIVIIRQSQDESFSEYKLLLAKQPLPKKSPLLKFNVFLDDDNVMRVGGRLANSDFAYDKKHPILIQSTHHFTSLLFEFEHHKLMHAGPQLLLASIREIYWPIGGRKIAKSCYRKCILCTRIKGKIVAPLMGNLPQQRITPGGYPFQNVGVDYAGPIMCASRQGRGCRLVRTYIAVFICFATKAMHLELVGDLTSNSFLLALNRFISRRGKPNNIYSDNGTSFVGAYNDLSKFLQSNCNSLSENLANDGVKFHFIPAYTPHFGGLWEAGVKSAKYHLQRVLGNCNLTFEALNTTLAQIEAILNSRPLTPLSSDPADYNPLTPGHFLIGRPLTALPQRDLQQHSTNHLTRFQRIEQLRQHFWTRWSKEYVTELQLRSKWRSCTDDLKLDALVVVKEDNLPPLKWKLGRIVAVHPGADNIVRVADIKTSSGIIRRAFSKICPLPISKISG